MPITPITPLRVARNAARTPGPITPTTGTSAAAAMSPIAETSIELQATTRSFTPRVTRCSAIPIAKRRISSSGRGPYGKCAPSPT